MVFRGKCTNTQKESFSKQNDKKKSLLVLTNALKESIVINTKRVTHTANTYSRLLI